jgi:hypothetical protein
VSNIAKTQSNPAALIEQVLVMGDLSKLSPEQRTEYYGNVCRSIGVNPLTRPFDYITLNGKLTLYAKRDATDQLRSLHKISVNITDRTTANDVYVVTAKARNAEGREDESTGAVNIANLKGDALANAMMKAETKAKRRVTLSICGLGVLDETEIETIPREAQQAPQDQKQIQQSQDGDPGEYVVTVGKKYKGQKLKQIPRSDIENYLEWLEDNAAKTGKPLDGPAQFFKIAALRYLEVDSPSQEFLDDPQWEDSAADYARGGK